MQQICSINTAKIGSDTVLLSDVPQKFYLVKEEIIKILPTSFVIEEEQKLILEMVDNRKTFCCQGIHYAANILDPRFKGIMLSEYEVTQGINFIVEMANRFDSARILANLAQYRANENIWENESIWESSKNISPLT